MNDPPLLPPGGMYAAIAPTQARVHSMHICSKGKNIAGAATALLNMQTSL